jgi:hypothetical protein
LPVAATHTNTHKHTQAHTHTHIQTHTQNLDRVADFACSSDLSGGQKPITFVSVCVGMGEYKSTWCRHGLCTVLTSSNKKTVFVSVPVGQEPVGAEADDRDLIEVPITPTPLHMARRVYISHVMAASPHYHGVVVVLQLCDRGITSWTGTSWGGG